MTSTGTQPKMPDDRPSGPDESEETLPEDYSIYPCMDGMERTTFTFLLKDYGDRGALSHQDIEELSVGHGIPITAIQTLSIQAGYTFDVDSCVAFVEVNRAEARQRAQKAVEKALEIARRGKVKQAAKLIENLADRFATEEPRSTALAEAKRLGSTGEKVVSGALVEALGLVLETQDAAFDPRPKNRKNVDYARRAQFVRECCYVWEECGEKVTYRSTETGGRGGPLIDFIQDAARRIARSEGTLPAETIRKDIDRFRKPEPEVLMFADPNTPDVHV